VLGARGTSEGGDHTVWTLASVAPEDSPTARQIITSRRWFEKATGNRVRVRPRFGGVLGDETTTLELSADERDGWRRALSGLGAEAERLGGPKGKALLASVRRSSGAGAAR